MTNEIKKEENIFSDTFKEDVKKIWRTTLRGLKKFWNWLSDMGIKKIIGFLIVLFSAVAIFFETIAIGLIHSDKLKFEEIINYFYGIKIFDYVSSMNFHLITGGGYLIDLAIYSSLIIFGIYLWKNKNYFKKKYVTPAIITILILGVISFSFAFYKAMPQIMIPLEKICESQEWDERGEWKNKKHRDYDRKEFFNNRDDEYIFQYIENSRF